MLEANSEAIVRLVWARRLGLDDEALATDAGAGRLTVPSPSDDDWGLLRLWGRTVLLGPPRMLATLADVPDDALADPAVLLAASPHPDGRLPQRQRLGYTDAYPAGDDGTPEGRRRAMPLVSRDPADASRLAGRCPPDDRIGLDLDALDPVVTLLSADPTDPGPSGRHRRLALAGVVETSGMLGRLQVLTDPMVRRRGHGTTAAAIAVEEALDQGLIVEGWIPEDQPAAVRLSESIRMSRSGCRIWSPTA